MSWLDVGLLLLLCVYRGAVWLGVAGLYAKLLFTLLSVPGCFWG